MPGVSKQKNRRICVALLGSWALPPLTSRAR